MDPKFFDSFNVLRPATELAENMAAALRVWDTTFLDALRIASDLEALRKSYTQPRWETLDGMTPPKQPNFPCTKFALEVFQILKLWNMTHRQMDDFCGRFNAFVSSHDTQSWKAWKPDLRPDYALPGLTRPN